MELSDTHSSLVYRLDVLCIPFTEQERDYRTEFPLELCSKKEQVQLQESIILIQPFPIALLKGKHCNC